MDSEQRALCDALATVSGLEMIEKPMRMGNSIRTVFPLTRTVPASTGDSRVWLTGPDTPMSYEEKVKYFQCELALQGFCA